jgi:phosphatidylethanolamine-binding protein (PEBP) family uncharacterized protein
MSEAAAIRFAIAVLAAAATLAVFGCGGDSATETASAPPSETTTTAEGQAQGKPASATQGASAVDNSTANQAAAKTPGTSPIPSAGKQGTQITPPKGPQEPEPTPQQRAQATLVSMSLTSPALSPGPESVSTLPAAYTCKGKDTWPELSWGGVPPGTAELVLFVLNLEPVNEALFFDWAVAGIDPGSTGTQSGQLPKGGVHGRNSFGKPGYSVCPPSSPETVVFALYALPQSSGAHKGFDPTALRKAVLDRSHDSGILAVRYGG